MTPVIVHIRASNFFGGPERQIVSHISASRRFHHLLLTFPENGGPNELFEKAAASGIDTRLIDSRFSFDPGAVISFRRILKEMRPRAICSHGYKPSVIALLAKAGLSIPLIIFSRGHTAENFKVRVYEKIEQWAIRFANRVVAVSGGYADHLIQCGIPEDKIEVVYNAIDVGRMLATDAHRADKRSELGFSDNDFLIATAGRLSPEKAQGDLIKAFISIQRKLPNAHLLIIGSGALEKDLKELAAAHSDTIHFLGFRKDMDAIMPAIDLFALPSLTEGLPNVVLEAFAARKPVVATRVGGVPEVVDDGVNGFLCSPGDPGSLSEAVLRAVGQKDLLPEMGRAGFEKVQQKFSVDAQARALEQLYDDVAPRLSHA